MSAEKDDGYIRWRCKGCGQKLKVKESWEGGEVIQCPRCGAMVNVPIGNIEAIAAGTDMEETGEPGRLQLDPEKLMKTLRGEEKTEPGSPGSAGSTPSVRSVQWDAESAYGRVEQLDQLASAVQRIDQSAKGDIQRAYRNKDLDAGDRAKAVKEAARGRLEEIRALVQDRLAGLRMNIQDMETREENLNRGQKTQLASLRRAVEAIKLYTRYVLRIKLD